MFGKCQKLTIIPNINEWNIVNITNMTNAETKRLRNYYAFKAAPTLLYIKNGEVVADFEGFMDKDTLTNWYKENVK